ncbi:MAG: AAA family ATPase [Lachnospiraceae bacterium]|nr:AAA family ATPase [Lachnospiraceae bacterium]
MNHEAYVNRVLSRLKEAIAELEETMEFRRSEIARMQEYYWESYTEYDEFGYEKIDNDRLLKEEADAHSELVKKYTRYRKMLDSPYFAAITFRYEGEEEEETYYIGIGDFSPKKGMVPLVCDWRAPISGLFYDYDIGPASFQAPEEKIYGELLRKFQYKIKGGKLLYVIDSEIVINDDILQKELSMNANARLKSIVTTIQKEQNAIIRNEKDKILVIQGCAGSGKTSVALHRVAYLLYHRRKQLTANQVLVLSPNPVFSEYISHILPELGEENILEMTFDLYAYRELKQYKDTEDRYEYLERLLTLPEKEALEYQSRVQEKQSKEYVLELNEFVLFLEDSLMNFRPFTYKKIQRSEHELRTLFYEKFPDIPILERIKTIAEYIIDEEETLSGKELDVMERDIIVSRLEKMYEMTDLFRLYNRFLKESGRKEIGEDARSIPYEDVYPMLYLKHLLHGSVKRSGIKHLIVDEMQDYSYVQFLILSKMFSCPMTILGDREQQAAPGKMDTQALCREIFGKEAKMLTLEKSYRSTSEITRFASRIAGLTGEEAFERPGKEPEWITSSNEQEMWETIAEQLQKEQECSGQYETTAVLTTTKEQAERLYSVWKDKLPVTLLSAESSRMEKGIVITTFYLAKGLEFDSVHVAYVPEEEKMTEYQRQILYIGATRALHELKVYGYAEKGSVFTEHSDTCCLGAKEQ